MSDRGTNQEMKTNTESSITAVSNSWRTTIETCKGDQEHSESRLGGYNWAELKLKLVKHLGESDHPLPFLCDRSQTAGAEKLAEKYETSPTKVKQPAGNSLEMVQYSQRMSSEV